jgi:drug/metabolite transporter (DMT)-like permease
MKKLHYATMLALGTAFISGTNTFLAKVAVKAINDPVLFTTLKNTIVALFLLGVLVGLKKWPEIKALTKRQWLKLVAIGAIGGSIPFALFFAGLSKTSAINAALIHKTLFLWVLLFAIPVLKEKVARWQWLGIGAIFGANLFIGGLTGFEYNTGELMILGATILWAVENVIAKITLKDLSSITVASARMVFGSVLLLVLVLWQGNIGLLSSLNAVQWSWAILTSVLLFGYVITWYTALKYAPATYVATLLVPAVLVTNILSAMFITHTMTSGQLASSLLYIFGLTIVIAFAKRTADVSQKEKELSSITN